MTIIGKFLIVLFFVLLSNNVVFSQSLDTNSLKLDWEQYVLSNGLTVLLQQDLIRSDISIEFWLHSGSAVELPGQYGLAHFFEHATPSGLQDVDSLRKEMLENINFSNAQTRPDFTRYHIQVQPEVFELGLRYVSDRLKADTSAITEEWVKRHRGNVLREIDRQAKHPLWGGEQRTKRVAGTFGESHPYGHSGYGSRQNNENFSAPAFRKWYSQYVYAENTTLYIIGNFDVDDAKALIANYFNDIHQKGKPEEGDSVSPKPDVGKEVVRAQTENHTLVMAWPVPAYGSEEDPGIFLATHILNERLSARGSWPGSVSDAGMITNLYQMAGELFIYATFSAISDSLVVEKYLKDHLQNMLTNGVSTQEAKKALVAEFEYVQGAINNGRMGMWNSRTALLGEGLLFTGDPDYYLTRLKKQSKLTTRQIQQAARKLLDKEPYQLLVISYNFSSKN